MMKTVIPHLRLLTLPVDQFHRELSKYLSDSQLAYLAKRLIFKDETSAGKTPPGLNVLTLSRSRPKSLRLLDKKFKFEFIAEDLIKSDWQMMGSEKRKNTTWNALQIKLVTEQHLFVQGIEILTKAKNNPEFKLISDGEESFR